MTAQPVKVLLQRTDRLGDMVLTLPMINHIKAQYPGVELHVLASTRNAELVKQNPLVDKLHIYDWSAPQKQAYRQLLNAVKKENYDIYISAWNTPKMAKLGKKAKIPIRIGDASNIALKHVYSQAIYQPWENLTRHQADLSLDLLKPLNIFPRDMDRHLPLPEHAKVSAQKLMMQCLPHTKKVVTVFCSTGGSNDPISETHLMTFVDQILDTGHYSVVLMAGLGDKLPQLAGKAHPSLLNLIGQDVAMYDMAALISLSDFYVGSDTGPSHLASFLNIPSLVYFPKKTTFPTRFGPLCDYFTLIRHEYVDPKEDSQTRGIDAERLYHGWCELVDQVTTQAPMTAAQKQHTLMKHSLRVLYLYRSQDEAHELLPTIKQCRREGLMIFPIHVQGSFLWALPRLLTCIRQRNITVIQGTSIPRWFMCLVREWMGVRHQYHRPVCVRQPLHRYIGLTDYLELYRRAFD